MSAANDEIRRKLGGDLPHEPVNMADMQFSVREFKPVDPRKQADEQCQGVNGELLKGVVLGAKQPFQDLDEAVERMIRLGVLK